MASLDAEREWLLQITFRLKTQLLNKQVLLFQPHEHCLENNW